MVNEQSGQSTEVEILSSSSVAFDEWVGVNTRQLQMPSGLRIERHIITFPDIVVIVAINGSQVVLVRQFRFPPHQWVLEVPAGKVASDEDPQLIAMGKLSKETGFRCGRMKKLGELHISPHLSSELTHVFLAEDLEPGQPNPAPGELLENVELPVTELRDYIRGGKITDAKSISAFVLAGLL